MEESFFERFRKQIQEAIEDLKTKGRRHRQIPNILTLMRLTAPCFIIPVAIAGNVPLILGLTAFFSLTDLADGIIARKFCLTSELGATLDAVTDKVFASTLLLSASVTQPFLLCNLALEGVIASVTSYKKVTNQPITSSLSGKLKTWFLFSLVGVGIASSFLDLQMILNTLIISTTVMQLLTIGSYLTQNTKNNESKYKIKESELKSKQENITKENKNQKLEKTKKIEILPSKQKTNERDDLKQLKAIRQELITLSVSEPEEAKEKPKTKKPKIK